MPRPTSSTVVQRPVLSALFQELMLLRQEDLAGLKVLQYFSSPERKPDIPVMKREALGKIPGSLLRAPRSTFARGTYEFDTKTFTCAEHGYEEPVDAIEAKMYRSYFSAEEWAMKRSMNIMLMELELELRNAIFNTTTFSVNDVTNEWDDAANATPRADVLAGIQSVEDATGEEPDTLLLPKRVFQNVLLTAEIKDYLQYTNPYLINTREAQRAMLSSYFGLDLIIGGTWYDSANEGQVASMGNMWGVEYGLIFKRSNPGDMSTPGLGHTFFWNEVSPQVLNVEDYLEPQTDSHIIRVRNYRIPVVQASEFGYLLGNLTTV